ncbi:MAG TPA: hypothetical protein VHX86_06350 [Tepidisphaeraceae bacterium]|nr:hypothetical protein [Tepidisphaeraceae bacterium]
MYKAFNLSAIEIPRDDDYAQIGRGQNDSYAGKVRQALDVFVTGGALQGNALQQHWFPTLQADVFISHSHSDESMAMGLAGWLWKYFKLRAFVDSSVWGHADHLLWEIDTECCRNEGRDTFSYEKRNGSTSHVHMMLSTALGMMIDRTECLIFLNTPQSITSKGVVSKTQSPWIFSELVTAKSIRRTIPARHRRDPTLNFSAEEVRTKTASALKIHYQVDLTPFADIDADTLNAWNRAYDGSEHALDALYAITPKDEIEVLSE